VAASGPKIGRGLRLQFGAIGRRSLRKSLLKLGNRPRAAIAWARLLEVLQRSAARRGNAAPMGNQAVGDPLAIGNELAANDLGILPARLLIRLWVGHTGQRRQAKAKCSQRDHGAKFHFLPPD
jgi:hypothetical protein